MSWESPFTPFIDSQGVVILDGGLGTELERQGVTLDPKLWSAGTVIDAPDQLKAVHTAYLQAGADVIIAASYQASIPGYMEKGHSAEEAERLLRRSVEIAVEARDEFWSRHDVTESSSPRPAATTAASSPRKRCRPLVAASVGCYAAFLADGSEYRGVYEDLRTVEDLQAWHAPRLRILSEAGADVLALETLPCESEVRALLGLLEEDEHLRSMPCWVSLACRDATHLNSGDSLESCGRLVSCSKARILSVGVNCTNPSYVAGALHTLSQALAMMTSEGSTPSRPPLLLHAYPNTGEVYEDKRWVVGSGTKDDMFSDMAVQWARQQRGARMVGGCCRTTPETIRKLREVLVQDSAAETAADEA